MKQKKSLRRFRFTVILLNLIFFACVASAQAQIFPHLDCVEPVMQNGVPTGAFVAHFGYTNAGTSSVIITDGPNNFFSPNPGGTLTGKQIITFHPGFTKRSFSIIFNAAANSPGSSTSNPPVPASVVSPQVTWFVQQRPATTTTNWASFCGSGTINYQGRLNVSGASANGQYDFQFQLYNQETGGTPQGDFFEMRAVTVTNGVFSVNLDVDHVFRNYTGNASFLEIRVKPNSSTTSYTALAPRQRLTAAPFAINAKNVSGGRVQLSNDQNATCTQPIEYGILRMASPTGATLQLCTASGWRTVTLQ